MQIADPKSITERQQVAKSCAKDLKFTMPLLIDELDDGAARAYGAYPDRLYIVGRDGKIAYRGGEGPRGFKPDELEERLHAMFESVEPKEKGRDEESPPSK